MTEVKLSRLGLQVVHNYVNSVLEEYNIPPKAFVDAKVVRRVVAKACDRSDDGTEVRATYTVGPNIPGLPEQTVEFKVRYVIICACTQLAHRLHMACTLP